MLEACLAATALTEGQQRLGLLWIDSTCQKLCVWRTASQLVAQVLVLFGSRQQDHGLVAHGHAACIAVPVVHHLFKAYSLAA